MRNRCFFKNIFKRKTLNQLTKPEAVGNGGERNSFCVLFHFLFFFFPFRFGCVATPSWFGLFTSLSCLKITTTMAIITKTIIRSSIASHSRTSSGGRSSSSSSRSSSTISSGSSSNTTSRTESNSSSSSIKS